MSDFTGFRFGNIHTKDLHLTVVSSSNRYTRNLLPEPTDYTVDVPGGDGKYYFGQTYGTREFTINFAFDDVDEMTLRRLSQIFSTDKPQDLVFDENPYKTYKAKLKSAPDLKYVCFKDRKTGQRIYKGEGSFNFICYHPLAFGFNKYVVRAADFYKCTQPQHIINRDSIHENPYRTKPAPEMLPGLIKNHYNVKDNMKTPWKGGYPTIEQVQWGELYFNEEHENNYNIDCNEEVSNPEPNKMIIDVRGYWDNIPKWQTAAKLLTTPTLDYEQELIYMPQFNKVNYYNMDTGLNKENGLIGSRILVYNPGDVPVDFELRLGNLTSDFRSNLKDYTFRISRYNVQRLAIDQAVDWTGLKTLDKDNEEEYKYGTQYFKILEANNEGEVYTPVYRDLKWAHPKHCYIAEPIPQEHLGYFIKLFYWQSNLLFNQVDEEKQAMEFKHEYEYKQNQFYEYADIIDAARHIFNHEEGIELANRYEELRNLCITEEEKNELYWNTLKILYGKYKEFSELSKDSIASSSYFALFNKDYTFEDFVYDLIYNPQEYIRAAEGLNYGEFQFNVSVLPQWLTFDYFDISSENFDTIPYAKCSCDLNPKEDSHREQVEPLFLDSESRMLYNINEPDWKNCGTFLNKYSEKKKNFFHFKPSKKIFNDNIKRGHWFQLPPGWSLIDVRPVVDEKIWGGKRWLDARPFDWGKNDKFKEVFDKIYRAAAIEYISQECPQAVFERYQEEKYYEVDSGKLSTAARGCPESYSATDIRSFLNKMDLSSIEDYLQFRRWFEQDNHYDTFGKLEDAPYDMEIWSENFTSSESCEEIMEKLRLKTKFELYQYRKEKAEIGFLKLLANYWRVNMDKISKETDLKIGNDIDDWWWYANNYIWANFPPLYWGYADLLNHAQIKYIPQFY